jgi:hypothetical protein
MEKAVINLKLFPSYKPMLKIKRYLMSLKKKMCTKFNHSLYFNGDNKVALRLMPHFSTTDADHGGPKKDLFITNVPALSFNSRWFKDNDNVL